MNYKSNVNFLQSRKTVQCLLVTFFFISCHRQSYIVNADSVITSHSSIVCEIPDHFKVHNNDKFLIKTLIWNDSCECGLIDVGPNKSTRYYTPVLIIGRKAIWLEEHTSGTEDSWKYDPTGNKSITKVMSYLESEDQIILENRLKYRVLRFGNSMLNSQLDFERDSLLLNKYFVQGDTIICTKKRSVKHQ